MTSHGDFVLPPSLPASLQRLAMVWEGDRRWTRMNFSMEDTKPGDDAVNVQLWDDRACSAVMPLVPKQLLEIGVELIRRHAILDPTGGAQ